MTQISLLDVVDDQIYDRGWRTKREDEYIVLNEAQKDSFVGQVGYGKPTQVSVLLRKYIDAPRIWEEANQHPDLQPLLGRMTWDGDEYQTVGRQDAAWDEDQIIGVIKEFVN